MVIISSFCSLACFLLFFFSVSMQFDFLGQVDSSFLQVFCRLTTKHVVGTQLYKVLEFSVAVAVPAHSLRVQIGRVH